MVIGEWPFFGCKILLFWLRNRLFLFAESPFFGCGIVFFWLRKRLFLVAEARLILVAESPKFGCGSVEIWFRNRNLSTYFGIGLVEACLFVSQQERVGQGHRWNMLADGSILLAGWEDYQGLVPTILWGSSRFGLHHQDQGYDHLSFYICTPSESRLGTNLII